jgi:hypothetical protein
LPYTADCRREAAPGFPHFADRVTAVMMFARRDIGP